MDNEMDDDLRGIRSWTLKLVLGLMILAGAGTIAGRAFNLFWFPWEVKMKTEMIRSSNSYVTTQQAALRQLYASYLDTDSMPNRMAIKRQMREIADLIPDDVQPDIRAFLGVK